MKRSFVYMVTNKPGGILYTGVTANLIKRIHEHREGIGSSFTKKYGCKRLVYYEVFDDIEVAIKREKKVKKMLRVYKDKLIAEQNPEWRDLYEVLLAQGEWA